MVEKQTKNRQWADYRHHLRTNKHVRTWCENSTSSPKTDQGPKNEQVPKFSENRPKCQKTDKKQTQMSENRPTKKNRHAPETNESAGFQISKQAR